MRQQSLSIVTPVYAGDPYLERLVELVGDLREQWRASGIPVIIGELILVDDAAIDRSPQIVDDLAARHDWIVAIHLSRNFGQHSATVAGIIHSSGDWVVTLDEDLQHTPSSITGLLHKAVGDHADVIYARPVEAVHQSFVRDTVSRRYKRTMQWLTGNPNVSSFNSFRLLRGSIARAAASVCGHDTYFDISLSWFTQSVGAVTLDMKDARFIKSGKSGYNFRSLVSHAFRLFYSSQIRFLGLGLVIGLALVFFTVFSGLFFLLMKLIAPAAIMVQGWTSLFLTLCLIGGLLASMLGVALKYLSTLVLKAHGKPAYFVVDRSGDIVLKEWFDRKTP